MFAKSCLSVLVFAFTLGVFLPQSAHAFGSSTPAAPPITTPNPVRVVGLPAVGTKAFVLPNGTPVDPGTFSVDLAPNLVSAVGSVPNFQAALNNQPAPATCGVSLEIQAAISSFELDATDGSITVGYDPSGTSVTAGLSASGTVAMQFGDVAMDFALASCTAAGGCIAQVTAHEDQATAGATASFQVNWSQITSTGQLTANTAIPQLLFSLMEAGIKDLTNAAGLPSVPWQTTVSDVTSATEIQFVGGTEMNIGVNQGFEILEPVSGSGGCGVIEPIAYVHTTSVEQGFSTAVVDTVLDSSTPIEAGDVVWVHNLGT